MSSAIFRVLPVFESEAADWGVNPVDGFIVCGLVQWPCAQAGLAHAQDPQQGPGSSGLAMPDLLPPKPFGGAVQG